MSDTIYTAPGATYFSELENTEVGLVGTLHVQLIRKSDGAVIQAPSAAGIVESPAGAGRYVFTGTAPTAAGDYTILWDTGTVTPSTTAADDLVVTASLAATLEGESDVILSAADYKTLRNLDTDAPQSDASLELAAQGATDAIQQFTDRIFTTAAVPATRTYTWTGGNVIEIDDCVSVSSVLLDGKELQVNRDFVLGPTTGVAQAFYWIDLYNAIVESPLMGFTRNEDVLARAGILDRRDRHRDRLVQAQVTGEFGFPQPLPASLRIAAAWLIDIIAPAVEATAAGGHEAEAIADLSYVNGPQESKSEEPVLPPRVVSLLEPFRRLSV